MNFGSFLFSWNFCNAYLDPSFIYYSKYFLTHLYGNWRSQYKHSNIKVSLIKYEKNMEKHVKKDPNIGSVGSMVY